MMNDSRRPLALARMAKTILLASFLMALSSCVTDPSRRKSRAALLPCFVELTRFSATGHSTNALTGDVTLQSDWIRTPAAWDELILSWNAVTPAGAAAEFEIRAMTAERPTKYYTLGRWAEDTTARRRESVPDQMDEDGTVETDTLVLRQPSDRMQLRITLNPDKRGRYPTLKRAGLALSRRQADLTRQKPVTGSWGRLLNVPEKSQLSYPGGREWCSPTSVSMVLAYWSTVLHRPELNVDVPEVAAGVFDRNWPGTGNWPFNTAFAGRYPGMRAIVTRLSGIADLEYLIAAGVPPILSVSYRALHGLKSGQSNGHLVVCVGFTIDGDPIVNDPWAEFEKGDTVRQVVSRENLTMAWAHSQRTVYLIHPETLKLPTSRPGRW